MTEKKLLLILILTSFAHVGTNSTLPAVSFMTAASAATELGDLTKFKKIAIDTQALVDKGDLTAAKARIKDLETNWDEAEAGIKSRDASNWHLLDKSIDKVLTALRADSPKKEDCKKSLADLRLQFEKLETK